MVGASSDQDALCIKRDTGPVFVAWQLTTIILETLENLQVSQDTFGVPLSSGCPLNTTATEYALNELFKTTAQDAAGAWVAEFRHLLPGPRLWDPATALPP